MNNELYHFGIKGQKWGIRRFQNADGTLTSAGKSRRNYNEKKHTDGSNRLSDATKSKLIKAAKVGTVVVGSAVAAYGVHKLINNPNAISSGKEALSKMKSSFVKANSLIKETTEYKLASNAGKKIMDLSSIAKPKVVSFLKSSGDKTVSAISDSSKRVGNAMLDASLISVGGIAITKVTEKLQTTDSDSEFVKNRNKVITDTVTAGIKAVPKSGSSNNKNNNNNNNIGKEVTDRIGAPSKKSIDKSSGEWQGLFKDSNGNQRDQNVRANIKSLASAGYDIDQIKKYLNDVDSGRIKHGLTITESDIGMFYIASLGM